MKKLYRICAALLCTIAVPASAAIISSSAVGSITSGTDYAGVFGAAGTNLTGQSYSQTISYERLDGTDRANGIYAYNEAANVTVTVSTTIGAVTQLKTVSGAWAQLYKSFSRTATGTGWDHLDAAVERDTGTEYFLTYHRLYSNQNAFGLSADLAQAVSRTLAAGDQSEFYFRFGDPVSPHTLLRGTVSSISFNQASSAVPEPASLALFGLGLAGLAASRRKRLPR